MPSLRFHSFRSISLVNLTIVVCVALLFAAIVPQRAVAQITNWREFQFGNNRLGFNPYEAVLGPSNGATCRCCGGPIRATTPFSPRLQW